MTLFSGERLRYGAYALLAVAAAAAYFLLDSGPDRLQGDAGRRAAASEELPVLQAMDTEVDQEARRDLFAFGSIEVAQETIAVPASLIPSQPDRPDPLASVQAMGVVRRDNSMTFLVRVGPRLVSVGLGQPFGDAGSLRVDSIEGSEVVIVDKTSGSSRNFRLSEE